MDLAIEAVLQNWQQVRDDLFEPVFRREPAGIDQLNSVVDAIDQLQRAEFERRGVYLGCPFGSVGQEMAHQDEGLQAAVDRVFEEHVGYFLRALNAAAEKGQVEPGDLRQRARNVLALLEGALLVAKVANNPDRFTEVTRALPRLIAADNWAD
jgi:TetR/AcrR family transcriptional repressor of nem operon